MAHPVAVVDVDGSHLDVRCIPMAHLEANFQILGDVPDEITKEELIAIDARGQQARGDRAIQGSVDAVAKMGVQTLVPMNVKLPPPVQQMFSTLTR